jgi:hypothetical protein
MQFRVPKGRQILVPQLGFIVFEFMLVKKGEELFLKCFATMVLGLRRNVFLGIRHAGNSNCKSPIAFLPVERP